MIGLHFLCIEVASCHASLLNTGIFNDLTLSKTKNRILRIKIISHKLIPKMQRIAFENDFCCVILFIIVHYKSI